MNFFTRYFKDKQNEKYQLVLEREFNQNLKDKIYSIEKSAEEIGLELQREYQPIFNNNKENLSIFVRRDIDGDVDSHLTSKQAFCKEYRSELVISFKDPNIGTDEEDLYIPPILLWYYYGGYKKGNGTLYNSSVTELKNEVILTLENRLNGGK